MRNGIVMILMLLGLLGPAPALAQQPSAAQAQQASEYRINAGDELEVYVWGEERLQRTVKVLPDGTIAFPLVGQVVAQGLLPQELERTLSQRLEGQYRGQVPQVTVSVSAASGLQFSVMGRVNSPGTFTPGRYVNVLEALSMAGGPNEFANLDNVLLIRKVGDRLQSYRLRLSGVFKGGANVDSRMLASVATLQSGDTVIVP
jgi:polysaccharide biosynthesis/export protein